MQKISSCHLEGGALSRVNKCFESVVGKQANLVWYSRIKGGGGKIGGSGDGGFLGRRTSSSSYTFGSLFAMNTSSKPRSDKSRSESSITGSTKGSLESLRVRVLRNDEIGFGGSGSTVNMFVFGGLEEAPIVGSGNWYSCSLSFFMGR